MYRRILVPVDGSNTSKKGLREALKLAASNGARVRFVHVVDEGMMPASRPAALGGDREFVRALKDAGTKTLAEAVAAAEKNDVRAECAQRMSAGRRVSEVILDEAKKWRADLIVIGTHGRRGLNRLLLGSDAERVLRQAPVPVLLVRGTAVN